VTSTLTCLGILLHLEVEQFDVLNLSVVNMVEPTYFQSGASSPFLDLFLTNSPSEVGFFT
jgi:hypothetical protein